MAKVIGIHRFVLKAGVKGADFEKFMREKVLSDFGIVFQIDKRISHDFTRAAWANAEHILFRSNQDGKDREYVWMIMANAADEKVHTEEARHAVAEEAQDIAQEFFDLGGRERNDIAAVKLRPWATHLSFESFLEMRQIESDN
jgi:hypothetical protein